MHAGKIRTANIPAFQLTPRDTIVLVSTLTLAAYIFGFFIGVAS